MANCTWLLRLLCDSMNLRTQARKVAQEWEALSTEQRFALINIAPYLYWTVSKLSTMIWVQDRDNRR